MYLGARLLQCTPTRRCTRREIPKAISQKRRLLIGASSDVRLGSISAPRSWPGAAEVARARNNQERSFKA